MKSEKASVLRGICAVGMMAFAATAAKSEVEIDGFKYELDTEAKTAALTGYTGILTKVQLGVAVLKTSDLTAEKKNWNKVKISKEDIDVDADGNIIVNVPVDSASGFMVIQTKDAKVGQ